MSEVKKIDPQQFPRIAHRRKQELLSQSPREDGGRLLDTVYGHEYEPYIHCFIPEYCRWPYLKAGGEQKTIVEAGRIGRLHGMQDIASDPFEHFTSGSALVIRAKIDLHVEIEYHYVTQRGWKLEQEREFYDPSFRLDDPITMPDGEEWDRCETVPDPSRLGDPVGDVRQIEALQRHLSKLTPETRKMVLRHLFTDIDISAIALERDQPYDTVQRRLNRGERTIYEGLRRAASSSFDRDARRADGWRRLLEKILEEPPP